MFIFFLLYKTLGFMQIHDIFRSITEIVIEIVWLFMSITGS
jgi:hypothetical protein